MTTNLVNQLAQFTGTGQYHYLPLFSQFNYTDGVKFLAKEAGAYWLLEKIFANQSLSEIRNDENLNGFQVWKLIVNEDATARLVCEDGNKNIVYSEQLTFTDFPLSKIELWLENKVLILPSEH